MIISLLIPIIDIIIHRIMWKMNKRLYIDLFITKKDNEKIREIYENE